MGKRSQEDFQRDQKKPQGPVVKADLAGKTVCLIGANTGLGFEAVKHLATMNPEKLILGCRNKEKGEAALKKLTEETGFTRTDLWLIDLSSFASVQAFADKVDAELPRLDILIENAGMSPGGNPYSTTDDGWEYALQTNNLGPELLAIRVLPKMVQTAKTHSTLPRLVVVASDVHFWIVPDEETIKATNVHQQLSNKDYCTKEKMGAARYRICKLFNIFFVRSLNSHLPTSDPTILVNSINPGFCLSELRRNSSDPEAFKKMEAELALTTEEGSRHIIYGATKGSGVKEEENKLKGEYISMSEVTEVADFVLTDDGKSMQRRVWDEMLEILGQVDKKIPAIVKEYLA